MTYIPAFHGQLSSGDPHGGVNCTAWSEAYAIDFASHGAKKTTGTRVRALSNEPVPDPDSPGLNLAQVDHVGTYSFNSPLDVQYGVNIDHAKERINDTGEAAHLQVGYAPIRATRYNAGRGFGGNHDLLWLPGEILMDPLADGRADGVYKFKGERYPYDLVKRSAGALNIARLHEVRLLGVGLCNVAFTTKPAVIKPWFYSIQPRKGFRIREFNTFVVRNGVVVGRPGFARTTGTSGTCTPPQRVLWSGHTSQMLVKITNPRSKYNGLWVRQPFAHAV